MNKKINLSVSSFLLVGLFLTGCSQQQINAGSQSTGSQQVAGGQQVAPSGSQQVAGGQQQVASGGQQSSGGQQVQPAPTAKPSSIDHQVQDVVVPKQPYHPPKVYQPKPRVKPVQRPHVMHKPVQRPYVMHKPVQRMAKPIQRHSVAYTDKRSAMPPAKPGQCYAKVKVGPMFKNIVKRVQVSPAVNKRVLVRGPQYSYVSKRVQVRPATHTYRYVPAQYKHVSKQVLVKPAHYAWQKGKKGPVTRIDNMTGEILCRVKIPAVYRTVVQKVLVRPAQRVKKHIPAVYQTTKHKHMTSPAQYKNVHQPARFINKTYRVKSGGVSYKWKPINC